MPLNHMFSITMCNTKLIVQLTFLIAILLLIAASVISACVEPVAKEISEIVMNSRMEPQELIEHPIKTVREKIVDPAIAHLKENNASRLIWIFVAIYFFVLYFLTIPQLPLCKVLYGKMLSGYDVGLFNTFISTGFQNLLLSLILSLVNAAVNIGLFIGLVFALELTFNAKAIVAVPFVLLAFGALFSLRSSIISPWLPEICASDSKNIFVGLKAGAKLSFKRMRKNFLCHYTLNLIFGIALCSTVIPTFGVSLIIGLPTFVVMRSILSLTLNFSYHRKTYYTDNGMTTYAPTRLF